MNSDTEKATSAVGTTWLRRVKVALAGLALAAVAVFGGTALGTPDSSADEPGREPLSRVARQGRLGNWLKSGGRLAT